MARCPSCQAELEPEADLCLECGEPIGDSPAARAVRSEHAAAPPPPEPPKVRAAAPPARKTIPATRSAIRRGAEEPTAIRCPGCGIPSSKVRCPGCGAVLRSDD